MRNVKRLPETMAQAEFARHIGLSRQRVGQLIAEGLPVTSGRRIRVAEAVEFIRSHIETAATLPVERATSEASDEPTDIIAARIAKLTEETSLLRLQIAEKERTLVSRDDVRRGLASFSRLQRDKWINFPNRFGAQIAAESGAEPRALMASLDRFVREQLNEIANIKPSV